MPNLKTEFNNYKKILRRSINEAKRQYYSRTFELYKNNIKQTWSVIKFTLQKNVRCPDSTKFDNVNNKLKNTSSYCYDNISNKHIKYARNILTKPLSLLINQCLHTGIYPSQLKLSRVKPLYKAGDKTQFDNYRPISLLPLLSKIFERVILDQLLHTLQITTYCV